MCLFLLQGAQVQLYKVSGVWGVVPKQKDPPGPSQLLIWPHHRDSGTISPLILPPAALFLSAHLFSSSLLLSAAFPVCPLKSPKTGLIDGEATSEP